MANLCTPFSVERVLLRSFLLFAASASPFLVKGASSSSTGPAGRDKFIREKEVREEIRPEQAEISRAQRLCLSNLIAASPADTPSLSETIKTYALPVPPAAPFEQPTSTLSPQERACFDRLLGKPVSKPAASGIQLFKEWKPIVLPGAKTLPIVANHTVHRSSKEDATGSEKKYGIGLSLGCPLWQSEQDSLDRHRRTVLCLDPGYKCRPNKASALVELQKAVADEQRRGADHLSANKPEEMEEFGSAESPKLEYVEKREQGEKEEEMEEVTAEQAEEEEEEADSGTEGSEWTFKTCETCGSSRSTESGNDSVPEDDYAERYPDYDPGPSVRTVQLQQWREFAGGLHGVWQQTSGASSSSAPAPRTGDLGGTLHVHNPEVPAEVLVPLEAPVPVEAAPTEGGSDRVQASEASAVAPLPYSAVQRLVSIMLDAFSVAFLPNVPREPGDERWPSEYGDSVVVRRKVERWERLLDRMDHGMAQWLALFEDAYERASSQELWGHADDQERARFSNRPFVSTSVSFLGSWRRGYDWRFDAAAPVTLLHFQRAVQTWQVKSAERRAVLGPAARREVHSDTGGTEDDDGASPLAVPDSPSFDPSGTGGDRWAAEAPLLEGKRGPITGKGGSPTTSFDGSPRARRSAPRMYDAINAGATVVFNTEDFIPFRHPRSGFDRQSNREMSEAVLANTLITCVRFRFDGRGGPLFDGRNGAPNHRNGGAFAVQLLRPTARGSMMPQGFLVPFQTANSSGTTTDSSTNYTSSSSSSSTLPVGPNRRCVGHEDPTWVRFRTDERRSASALNLDVPNSWGH